MKFSEFRIMFIWILKDHHVVINGIKAKLVTPCHNRTSITCALKMRLEI